MSKKMQVLIAVLPGGLLVLGAYHVVRLARRAKK